uniref:Uncharacterized protein n=1 Tax=Cacopsylla melanoneura TaxID=428564 RepID=A0A8D8S440_9HEMI
MADREARERHLDMLEDALMEMHQEEMPGMKHSKRDQERQWNLLQKRRKEIEETGHASNDTIDDLLGAVFKDSFVHELVGQSSKDRNSSNSKGGDGQGSSSTRGLLRKLCEPLEDPKKTK